MSKTLQELRQEIFSAVRAVLGENIILKDEQLEIPHESEMGDFSFPCFSSAKELKMKEAQLAEEIQRQIVCGGDIQRVSSSGGYVNFFLDQRVLFPAIFKSILSPPVPSLSEKVMIEYSQPNTHKEFHIGHLRNVCLGAALVNIFRFLGQQVTAVNYLNDMGAHVAKCLWAYLHLPSGVNIPKGKGEFLGKLYVEANQKAEEDEGVRQEVAEIQQKLEAGDPQLQKIWRQTRQWSIDDFEAIYRELHVVFDHVFYESDIVLEGKEIAEELVKHGIAKQDQGAVLVDLRPYNLDVLLLLKSDGTALYSAKDLALAQKKSRDFDIEKGVIVTDSRQILYFKQVFKTLELAGFKPKFIHIPYESVMLKEGSMSSRKGNVVLYTALRDQAYALAYEETKKRHPIWDNDTLTHTSQIIALAAVKFWMLKHENTQVITFDLKKAVSFEGDTGPYALYTYARAQSILRKAKNLGFTFQEDEVDFAVLSSKEERKVLHTLQRWTSILTAAADAYKPALIATFLMEFCQAFNEFYHSHLVLDVKAPALSKARLFCVDQGSQLIAKGLELLNIEYVQEM